jgi:hypothetical protein
MAELSYGTALIPLLNLKIIYFNSFQILEHESLNYHNLNVRHDVMVAV